MIRPSTTSGTLPPVTSASLNVRKSKRGPSARSGEAAQPVDLAMADLVAAGLARPGAIAVDLALDVAARRAVGGREPLDRMVAGPALGVEPGVDHQPAGAERNRLKIAEPPERIALVAAELVAELLGIERPAFRISVEGEQRAHQRQAISIFALPDMARYALVIGEGGRREARPGRGVVQVDVVDCRARSRRSSRPRHRRPRRRARSPAAPASRSDCRAPGWRRRGAGGSACRRSARA